MGWRNFLIWRAGKGEEGVAEGREAVVEGGGDEDGDEDGDGEEGEEECDCI